MATEEQEKDVQILNEEDDFDLTVLADKSKKGKEAEDNSGGESDKSGKKADDEGADKKKEDEEKAGDDQQKEKDDKSDDLESRQEEDKKKDEDGDKDEDGTAGKKEDEKEDAESDEDIFLESAAEEKDDQATEKIDYNALGKEAGIETDEEIKDKNSFIKATKKAIEASKQQLDLSAYNDDAQKLIKHLNEKKGDLQSFFENPVISHMNRVLELDPEQRFRQVRYAELLQKHNDEEKAIEALEEEVESMSKGELKTKAEGISEQAKKLRDAEIQKIIGDNEERVRKAQEKQAETAKEEVENIKSFVNNQDSFFGINLSKDAKATILKEIDNGKFDQLVNKAPEASKFFAYMVGKYGSRIIAKYDKALKEANREGFNTMQDKAFDSLSKSKSGAGQKGAGHKEEEKGAKRNFDYLTDDLFEQK